jgi:L-aminopeptidase/D-esterase-like protein
MHDAITDVAGIEVGHATDADVLTGCTAVLCRAGAVAGVDVRGAAPGTRETDLCRPGRLVERAQAVALCGGSAFGLEAASGVARFLADEGIGFDAVVARVPIVPAAVIFDLGLGAVAWPDLEAGRRAAAAASAVPPEQGCVGAGTGATVGLMLGPANATKGGIGTASVRAGAATVGALVVVNAGGDVVDPATGEIVAGARDPQTGAYVGSVALLLAGGSPPPPGAQTTIGVVATDARLSVEQANHLAAIAHDGLARAIRPAHTMFDGDTLFALATGSGAPPAPDELTRMGVLAVDAVERATLNAVRHATPLGGLPAAGG